MPTNFEIAYLPNYKRMGLTLQRLMQKSASVTSTIAIINARTIYLNLCAQLIIRDSVASWLITDNSAGRSLGFSLSMFVSDICNQTSNIFDYGVEV